MRVIYRGDLDGIVSAAILMEVGLCDELVQAHPKDMQAGKVDVQEGDIICNLPYHSNCGMWFDHHSSVIDSSAMPEEFTGLVEVAPSAAGLVFKYFLPDHPELSKYEQLVKETDLVDSADLTLDQVKNPEGAFLLGFLTDPRTGMGYQQDLNISNFQWVSSLVELLTKYSVEEVLDMPDSKERVNRYLEMQEVATVFFSENSHLDRNVIVSDFRRKDILPANRFLIYTLDGLSEGNISVRISDGKAGEFDVISVGYSIFNKTSNVDCGALCASYGGGGHTAVATCQPALDKSAEVFQEIITACRE